MATYMCRYETWSRLGTTLWKYKNNRKYSSSTLGSDLNVIDPATCELQSIKRDGFYPDPLQCTIFNDMVEMRRKQAASSVVVQVSGRKSAAFAREACRQHGEVRHMVHHSLIEQDLFVVEYESEDCVRRLLKSCKHTEKHAVVPSISPFLWLRAGSVVPKKDASDTVVPSSEDDSTPDLLKLLSTAKSISDQMGLYQKSKRIPDVEQRLRWITCTHLENIFSGLFPLVQVCPFGSSINGCGRSGSDLDMVLSFDPITGQLPATQSSLVLQAKAANLNQRLQTQRHMQVMAEVLQNMGTGFVGVQKILQARVPIIKFRQEFTGMECDLSLNSQTGVYMAELIYTMGEIDWRFRPLVTTVRLWAESSGLTRSLKPGPYITNFTLALLVVFFFQRVTPAILPTLDEMIKLARPQDRRRAFDVDCTFLRDPQVFAERAQSNTQSLEELLVGFLQFVEAFPFEEYGLSVIWGDMLRKTETTSLYVQNPLERELNVSKNVNGVQVERLPTEARVALHLLESSKGDHWGLLSFLNSQQYSSAMVVRSQKTQISTLNLKHVFETAEDPQPTQSGPTNSSDINSNKLQSILQDDGKTVNNNNVETTTTKQVQSPPVGSRSAAFDGIIEKMQKVIQRKVSKKSSVSAAKRKTKSTTSKKQ